MKPIRLTAFLLIVLLALFLAACSGTHRSEIVPPQAVVSPRLVGTQQNAQNLEIAAGSDGSHHLIYEEEADGDYRLVYAYQKFAETPRLLVIPPGVDWEDQQNPDIAVTSDGRVYIVWQMVDSYASGAYNCYASFLPTATTPPTCTPLDTGDGAGYAVEGELPTLVAEGDTVYAVYSVYSRDDVMRHQLKVVRLAPTLGPPVRLHDVDHGTSRLDFHRPALAIDDDGTLHAAYVVYSYTPSSSDRLYYARVTAGNAADVDGLLWVSSKIEIPAIAIETNPTGPDQIYYLANVNPRTPDGSKSFFYTYSHPADAATIPAPVAPLPMASNFIVPGSPSLVIDGGIPTAFFAGSSTEGANQIYRGGVDTIDGSFYAVQDTPFVDCAPKAVMAEEPNPSNPEFPFTSPVVVWRNCSGGTVQDIYAYDVTDPDLPWRVRQVPGQSDTNTAVDYDLAAYGDDVFAAWIDEYSESDPRLVPWISTNGYITQLPVLLR